MFSGVLGANSLSNMFINGPAGGNIKSIQHVTVASGTPATAAISAVDITKTIVYPAGYFAQDVVAKLTNSTTLSAHNYGGPTYASYWWVVEYVAVKSLQLVEASLIDQTHKDHTITAVTIAKTLLYISGDVYTVPTGAVYPHWADLQNTTTMRINTPTYIASTTSYFNVYIVEFP